MKKTSVIFTALFLSFSAHAEQFVSLTLCSDRLLAEIARPEQIAAMSPYSQHPRMMLDKINRDKPILEPQLTALLPYLDKTLLINETFYPQLVADLKRLGAKIVPINDSPQTPEALFDLMLQLGKLLLKLDRLIIIKLAMVKPMPQLHLLTQAQVSNLLSITRLYLIRKIQFIHQEQF